MKKLIQAILPLIMAMPTIQALESQKAITAFPNEEPEALIIHTEKIDTARLRSAKMLDNIECNHHDTATVMQYWSSSRPCGWQKALAWLCCCPCLTYDKIERYADRCPDCGHY